MMRRNLYILAIASLLSGNYVFAQDAVKQWSLEECIQYAIEHNIDLKQKEQEQESRKVDLHTSKYSWLPALNGSLGQSFQFGRSTSKSGVIVDQNAANSTLGINLDMPLFDGLKIPNDIAARKLDLKASIENLNKAREDLSINIASYYLQVPYNRTLTPFGFQTETRTYWEVPEIYNAMSPFMSADKLHGALLIIHGEMDNNSGTFPIQSERLFSALKGHGAIARYVVLPYESHGYAAKENILHLLYECDLWLDRYVKNAKK